MICLFTLPGSGFCASPLDHYEALFDTLLRQRYAEAEVVVSEMATTFGDHPGVVYARASIYYAKISDFEDSTGMGVMEELVEQCLAGCREWEKVDRDSAAAERNYLTGAAYSISGLARHKQGRTIEAVRRLMASRKFFDRTIQLDSTFYDAYVGRGAYRYAAAANLSALRWLPFVPTKRVGWEDLEIGLQKSRFSRYAALSAMVWLVIEEGNYELADSMAEAGLARYPGSRTFLLPKLAIEKRTGNWSAAQATALELVRQFEALEFNNGYELIGLHRTLMECADSLGDQASAVQYAKAGLAVQATKQTEERRHEALLAMRERLLREERP